MDELSELSVSTSQSQLGTQDNGGKIKRAEARLENSSIKTGRNRSLKLRDLK